MADQVNVGISLFNSYGYPQLAATGLHYLNSLEKEQKITQPRSLGVYSIHTASSMQANDCCAGSVARNDMTNNRVYMHALICLIIF